MTSLHHLLGMLDPQDDGERPAKLRTGTITDVGPPVKVRVGGNVVPAALLAGAWIEVGDEVAVITRPGDALVLGRADGGPPGWVPIDSGSVSAVASFTIDVPSGVYSMLRLHMEGSLSSASTLWMRVNSDGTTIYEQAFTDLNVDGSVSASGSTSSTSRWQFAIWDTSAAQNTAIVTIMDTEGAALAPFIAQSRRPGGIRRETWGALNTTRTITSLQIAQDGGVTISGRYWLEGFKS